MSIFCIFLSIFLRKISKIIVLSLRKKIPWFKRNLKINYPCCNLQSRDDHERKNSQPNPNPFLIASSALQQHITCTSHKFNLHFFLYTLHKRNPSCACHIIVNANVVSNEKHKTTTQPLTHNLIIFRYQIISLHCTASTNRLPSNKT